jgi:hypothetical protein
VTGRKGSQLTFFNPFSSVWKTAIAAKNTVDDFNFKVLLAAHAASGVQSQNTSARHACVALSTTVRCWLTLQGVGSIMGGIIVMQAGSGGVEYIFTEKNFGQFASNEEVKTPLDAVY